MSEKRPHNELIRGEALDADELASLSIIDTEAIISAIEWWEETAPADWKEVLDKEPIEDI